MNATYTLCKGTEQLDPIGNTAGVSSILDDYLRKRLKPVEGAIPHLDGIEMYGNSIPAANADGDLFEHINFQQCYDIDRAFDARTSGPRTTWSQFLKAQRRETSSMFMFSGCSPGPIADLPTQLNIGLRRALNN